MLGSGQGAPLPPSAIQNAYQLAIEHQRGGRPAEAEAICRQILASQSDHLDAMRLLAFLTHSSGRTAEAIEWIRRTVALRPDSADLHGNLGVLLASQGRFDDAIVSFRRALELNPAALEGYIELSAALGAKGQLDEAVAVIRQAVALQPNNPILRNNLGNALLRIGHADDAIAEFRQALAVDPRSPEAHCNLGNAFNQKGQIDEALAAYQQAVALRPDYIEALNNLGVVLFRLNQSEQAISTLRRAAALNPNHAETFYNLGVAFMEQSRPTDAITAYRRALTLRPRYGQAAWNLAWAYLLTGDFRQGWAFYEARWGTKEKFLPHNFPEPAWDGRPLEGRRIFIYAEQGFGDVIQMARLVPLVRDRGGRVILEVQPELKSLMTSLPGAEQVIAYGEPIPPFNAHCPLMSVPGRLDIPRLALAATPRRFSLVSHAQAFPPKPPPRLVRPHPASHPGPGQVSRNPTWQMIVAWRLPGLRIDHALDAVLQQNDIEIDEQPERLMKMGACSW